LLLRITGLALALALASASESADAATLPPPIATACTGCHRPGDNDPALPQLAGQSADAIVAAMAAFRAGKRPATVMDRIAGGYSDDEIAAIAAWYAAQR
jgi:cytochrome subunit of sulfide dehydrogenase